MSATSICEKRARKPPVVELPPLSSVSTEDDMESRIPEGPTDRSKGLTTPVNSDASVHAAAATISLMTPSNSKKPVVGGTSGLGRHSAASSGDPVVTLFPRRKAGQMRPGGGRGPVVLSLEMLEQYYGFPLHLAAKKLVSS